MTFVLFGLLSSGRFLVRRDLTKIVNLAPRALRPLLSRLPPRGNFFGSFAPWDFFCFFFPPFRWAGEAGGVSGCTWCCVWWGFLPSRSASVEREGWKCFWAFVWRERARFLLSFAFGRWRWGSCPLSTDFPFPCLRVCGLSLILTARSTT